MRIVSAGPSFEVNAKGYGAVLAAWNGGGTAKSAGLGSRAPAGEEAGEDAVGNEAAGAGVDDSAEGSLDVAGPLLEPAGAGLDNGP